MTKWEMQNSKLYNGNARVGRTKLLFLFSLNLIFFVVFDLDDRSNSLSSDLNTNHNPGQHYNNMLPAQRAEIGAY